MISASYPALKINLSHLKHNVIEMQKVCGAHDLSITAITKVVTSDLKIVQTLVNAGITRIGDSRISNLMKLTKLEKIEKWLIRMPMKSETDKVVKYSDVSLNSELSVIYALNESAIKLNIIGQHKVILMVDLGDLREGYVDYDELIDVAQKVDYLSNIELYGLATNLTCLSFVQTDNEKMKKLIELTRQISTAINRQIQIVSGGNSASINSMLNGDMPNPINNIRLGESILFGKERATYKQLDNMYNDIFMIECEIIEIKEKPSIPWGNIGFDSYGNQKTFADVGIQKRIICALGKQDFDFETCSLDDQNLKIIGCSSDHLLIDATSIKYETNYKVGDIIKIKLGYFATLRAFLSSDIQKIYI